MKLLLLLLLPTALLSQKIKVNTIDKFTQERRIETDTKALRMGLSCFLAASYRAVDTTLFIAISGMGCGVGVIGTDEQFIFLLSDKSTVTVKSKSIQDYNINTGYGGNSYNHEYYITKNDIKKLSENTIESVRAYYSEAYEDIEVKKKDALIKLSKIFLEAIMK